VGQRYAQRFANPSRAVDKLFCNERSAAGSVNESFSQLMCSNDTAIQSIDAVGGVKIEGRGSPRLSLPAAQARRELFDRGDNILISCGAEKLVAASGQSLGQTTHWPAPMIRASCLTRRIEQMVTFPHSRQLNECEAHVPFNFR